MKCWCERCSNDREVFWEQKMRQKLKMRLRPGHRWKVWLDMGRESSGKGKGAKTRDGKRKRGTRGEKRRRKWRGEERRGWKEKGRAFGEGQHSRTKILATALALGCRKPELPPPNTHPEWEGNSSPHTPRPPYPHTLDDASNCAFVARPGRQIQILEPPLQWKPIYDGTYQARIKGRGTGTPPPLFPHSPEGRRLLTFLLFTKQDSDNLIDCVLLNQLLSVTESNCTYWRKKAPNIFFSLSSNYARTTYGFDTVCFTLLAVTKFRICPHICAIRHVVEAFQYRPMVRKRSGPSWVSAMSKRRTIVSYRIVSV